MINFFKLKMRIAHISICTQIYIQSHWNSGPNVIFWAKNPKKLIGFFSMIGRIPQSWSEFTRISSQFGSWSHNDVASRYNLDFFFQFHITRFMQFYGMKNCMNHNSIDNIQSQKNYIKNLVRINMPRNRRSEEHCLDAESIDSYILEKTKIEDKNPLYWFKKKIFILETRRMKMSRRAFYLMLVWGLKR